MRICANPWIKWWKFFAECSLHFLCLPSVIFTCCTLSGTKTQHYTRWNTKEHRARHICTFTSWCLAANFMTCVSHKYFKAKNYKDCVFPHYYGNDCSEEIFNFINVHRKLPASGTKFWIDTLSFLRMFAMFFTTSCVWLQCRLNVCVCVCMCVSQQLILQLKMCKRRYKKNGKPGFLPFPFFVACCCTHTHSYRSWLAKVFFNSTRYFWYVYPAAVASDYPKWLFFNSTYFYFSIKTIIVVYKEITNLKMQI